MKTLKSKITKKVKKIFKGGDSKATGDTGSFDPPPCPQSSRAIEPSESPPPTLQRRRPDDVLPVSSRTLATINAVKNRFAKVSSSVTPQTAASYSITSTTPGGPSIPGPRIPVHDVYNENDPPRLSSYGVSPTTAYENKSNWKSTLYAGTKVAIDIVKESSDVFAPLKSVAGGLSAVLKYYDQTMANRRAIESLVSWAENLAESLTAPVPEGEVGEIDRREKLESKLRGTLKGLKTLEEQGRVVGFLNNAKDAEVLAGISECVHNAMIDYQTALQQDTYLQNNQLIEQQGAIDTCDCGSPRAIHPVPGSSTLVNFNVPAWKRLCSNAFPPPEVISLAEAIFMNTDEIRVVCNLRGGDAQSFIDATHKILNLPDLPPHLWGNCLRALRRVCGRQALLPRSLQITTCSNRLNKPLFQGGFADVWKGKHQGCDVAVKVLRVYSNSNISQITSRFCKEVVTWNTLRHPNVLSLLGATMDEGQFAMVSEWMVGGSINQFVKAHREANRFELFQDVAGGLIYMHSRAIIHGDLKGANILIDQNGRARLADFGLLVVVSDPAYFTASSAGPTGGTTRWMSPELLDPDQFGLDDSRPTKESDCYALGMVIYEVLSGQIPFAQLRNHVVNRRVIEGKRPERPEGAIGVWFTDDLWEILNWCWAGQAQNRPSIEEVLGRLEALSSTWAPLSPAVSENAEMDETDWDTLLVTSNKN